MARKPRPGPDAHAWLYLIGRSETEVKIGITSRPKARLQQHRLYGHVVLWCHYSASGSREQMFAMERACVDGFRRAGFQRGNRSEEFQGITKGQAIRLVRETVAYMRPRMSNLAETSRRFDAERSAWAAFRQGLYAEAV